MGSDYSLSSTRGLGKSQLGGVIFGLPKHHMAYVKRIEPGLPLFLFNYSDRTLLGIFEAASSGQENLDPYAWTCAGLTKTPFPAQLDHAQTNRLLSLLSSQAISGPRTTLSPHSTNKKTALNGTKSLPSNIRDVKTYNAVNEKDIIRMKLAELDLKQKLMSPSTPSDKLVGPPSADCKDQSDKINHLEQRVVSLEKNLAEAKKEIKNLKGVCDAQELQTSLSPQKSDDVEEKDIYPDGLPDDSILLVGGYDGASWLSTLDRFSPSQNLTKSLNPMNNERSYAAVSMLDGELYVFGGVTRGQWFDTVESYNVVANEWTSCHPLNQKKGCLAGATVNDKIYAFGGGNGVECYATVEMLDFDIGSWIPARSMLEKRFSLAAAEINGAIYAAGGFNGKEYLRTAERYDPREHSWKKIESMKTAWGCPSIVVLNEKLFILGGYDSSEWVSTVEIYDPRRGSWMIGEPMKIPRGFAAAAVVKDCIYVFGGLKNREEYNDTVECYKEGQGWKMAQTSRRCFFSAIAL